MMNYSLLRTFMAYALGCNSYALLAAGINSRVNDTNRKSRGRGAPAPHDFVITMLTFGSFVVVTIPAIFVDQEKDRPQNH